MSEETLKYCLFCRNSKVQWLQDGELSVTPHQPPDYMLYYHRFKLYFKYLYGLNNCLDCSVGRVYASNAGGRGLIIGRFILKTIFMALVAPLLCTALYKGRADFFSLNKKT